MNDGSEAAVSTAAKAGIQTRRTETEKAIVEAFERVLAREDLDKIGVNAVAAEAGVGKPLIYRYFGGFDGLVAKWAQDNKFWDDDQGLVEDLAAVPPDADRLEIICSYLIAQATRMRDKPIVLKAKISELLGNTSLTPGLHQARASAGEHHGDLYDEGGLFGDPAIVPLLLVMHAATHYLAMRTVKLTTFDGLNLKQDAEWEAAMNMVRSVFKDAVNGQKSTKTGRKTPGEKDGV